MCNLFRRLTLSLLVGISALVFTAMTINTAIAVEVIEEAKLTASDGVTYDRFGYSVAVDGNAIVIGSPWHDVLQGLTAHGSAYVFLWDGANWIEQPKLTASDAAEEDNWFGTSVAMDDDTIVIGAPYYNNPGAAYVFKREGMSWVEQVKLTASDGAVGDRFGDSVTIDGDTLVIGAASNRVSGRRVGAAYVFSWDGANWIEQPKLTASDADYGDSFGNSVAVDGDTIVIGAHNEGDGSDLRPGAAYVFKRDGMNWVEQVKLTGSDRADRDRFGDSVVVDGDTIVISSRLDDELGDGSGAVYVFKNDGASWFEQAKLTASDGGAIAGEWFGSSIVLAENTIVISTPGDDESGYRSGSAYVFIWDGLSWLERAKITASDGVASDQFGTSIAADGGTVVIGSNVYAYGQPTGPATYVFSLFSSETPPGEDIVVRPLLVDENGDPVEHAPAVSLTFDSVSTSGDTSVIITKDGPQPPSGFELMGTDTGATYIDVETTATFEGDVEICINYSGFELAVDPASLSLAHIVDGEWIDITLSNDVFNKVLCGLTPSFSYFAIVQVADPVVLLAGLETAVNELDAQLGISESLGAMLAKIERLMEDGYTVSAAGDLVNKFIPQVQKYSDKHISVTEADDLVRRATELYTVLLF